MTPSNMPLARTTRTAFAVAALAVAAGTGVVGLEGLSAKEKKPQLVSYQKDSGVGLGAFGGKLLHSYGYKDKQLENGNWEVTGQAKSANPVHSQYIALYRAAELATVQGKLYIRIVSVNGRQLSAVMAGANGTTAFSGPAINYGTRYVAEVAFVGEADSEGHCDSDVLAASCRTIDVARAMEQIRPHLKIKARK